MNEIHNILDKNSAQGSLFEEILILDFSVNSNDFKLTQQFLLIQFVPDPRFEEVKEFVRSGVFGSYNYDELIGSLEGNEGFGRADYFLVGKDFPSYMECQEKVDEAYRDQKVSLQTFYVYYKACFI